MDAARIAIAQRCMDAAHDGSMSFPAIVGTLIEAGFEGYEVNYRNSTQLFYTADEDCATLPTHPYAGQANPVFSAKSLEALVRWAQSGDPAYSYPACGSFSDRHFLADAVPFRVRRHSRTDRQSPGLRNPTAPHLALRSK